jgi:S1-C subfamily serine protease
MIGVRILLGSFKTKNIKNLIVKRECFKMSRIIKESFKERIFRGEIILIIVLIIISQAITFYYMSSKFETIKGDLENSKKELNTQINKNNQELEGKINTLTLGLIDTKQNFSTQISKFTRDISEIKASADSDFSGIIEDAIKGVVTIKTDVSQGTGFLITDDGYLITNAHVIKGARFANVYTYNEENYSSDFIGYDSDMDIALLKIIGDYNSLTLGNSNKIKIGEKVVAIGNPLGLGFSVTQGIISAVDREGPNEISAYIQTDTALNPGNSGGPLIDTQGEVIGINNFKISGENIGFALESNYIKKTVNNIALQNLNQTII